MKKVSKLFLSLTLIFIMITPLTVKGITLGEYESKLASYKKQAQDNKNAINNTQFNIDKANKEIENLKSEHKKARHIVYAYKFLSTAGKSDDKEPSGTAGTPLYNLLEMNNLNNKLLVVVRYFGGVKLGAGPLMRAYKNAGVSVIN